MDNSREIKGMVCYNSPNADKRIQMTAWWKRLLGRDPTSRESVNPAMNQEPIKAEISFLIEEYKNIAATHDRLRDELSRLFNYFLLLSAFPFTVAGIVFRQGNFDLLAAPQGLHFLFLFVGIGDLFLTLTVVDARHGQYRYARTVNLIRKYFVDKAPDLDSYLYLPKSADVPGMKHLGHITYQIYFMNFVGSVFVAFGVLGLVTHWGALFVAIAAAGAYLATYKIFRKKILGRFS
jgi:hypothetical protein